MVGKYLFGPRYTRLWKCGDSAGFVSLLNCFLKVNRCLFRVLEALKSFIGPAGGLILFVCLAFYAGALNLNFGDQHMPVTYERDKWLKDGHVDIFPVIE